MSEIKHKFTLKAIVEYISYRLKKDVEESSYRVFMAESLATVTAGKKTVERIGFVETYNRIWNIKKQKEDNRTAEEIINDTFAKHGLKIKKSKEEQNEPI